MEALPALDYKSLYEASAIRISALEHELNQLKKLIYGSRGERFAPVIENNPSQLTLGIEQTVEAIASCSVIASKKVEYTRTKVAVEKKPLAHPGRTKLPDHLRREKIVLEPEHVAAGSKRIGEEITEELEYQPGELFVKQFVRPKYVLAVNEQADTTIAIAPMPVRPLEKAIAGPGLLAQVIIDKYVDHLPLHRQMQRFERAGVKLAYSTLTDWVSGTCRLIEPLYEALKAEVLQSGYLHADETPIKVLDSDKKQRTHRGYFWAYNHSPGRLVFFDYQEGRGEQGPQGILKDFKGYLQTDGYAVYDSFGQKEGIRLFHCMAHARRYFAEARDNDAARADYALEQIQTLYAIERRCREENLDHEQRREIRAKEAVPILDALGKWMKQQYTQVLPKSPIGKALGYSIERWDRLCVYATDGILNIDNNPVENSIRPVAIGRKNYLFCGSHEAAKRTATLYSLLGTCKMNGVNPFDWLRNVLEIIPSHPINRIRELLPHRWCPRQN